MKTKQLFLLFSLFLLGAITKGIAQATSVSVTNTVTAAAYLGSGATSNFDVLFKRNAVSSGRLATTFTTFGVNTPLLGLPSSVLIGVNAGQFSSSTIGQNTYVGHNAGKGTNLSILNTGILNTFLGFESGAFNTTGASNTFIGHQAGAYNQSGGNNTFIGIQCGFGNTIGVDNVFLGSVSGSNNAGGSKNVFIGTRTGSEFAQGNNNCFIGADSGVEAFGSNNIFLGTNSGATFQGSNRLLIDVIDTQNSLIWGDFAADQLKFNGKVGIGGNSTTGFGNFPTIAGGVNVSTYNLFVTGGILTEEVRVNLRGTNGLWADYVFNKDYNLKPLSEVETFIKENGHLPNVPSAAQVKEEGIELGNMAKIQQEKIEELTLYIIEQNKINEKQGEEIAELKKLMTELINKK